MNSTVVSSSGKVLLAGGYLVLDPSYSGLVVSTSSRFYTVIRGSAVKNQIYARSSQFLGATWHFVTCFEGGHVTVEHITIDESDTLSLPKLIDVSSITRRRGVGPPN